MSPAAGGQYVYLRDAYHPLVAFLYGWALFFMIESGAMAAVAMTFAEYAVRLVSDQPQASALDRRRRRSRGGDWRDRVPVDHQLPRRHSRQPPAERVCGAEGCRARGPDRGRLDLQRRAGLRATHCRIRLARIVDGIRRGADSDRLRVRRLAERQLRRGGDQKIPSGFCRSAFSSAPRSSRWSTSRSTSRI